MTVCLFIPGPPRGKGRPKFFRTKAGGVGTYTPEETASYENLVKTLAVAAMAGRAPLEGAVWLSADLVHPLPASASKKRRAAMLAGEIRPTTKPDADNVLKALLDGLNRVAFTDDQQVTDLTLTRRYGETPGVSLALGPCRAVNYGDLL